MSAEHRHVAKKQFCPRCDHFHELKQPTVPGASGLCLLRPPQAFMVGMAVIEPSVIAKPDAAPQQVPVIRAYYPPVGPVDTCAQWTQRSEGEA